MDTSQFHVGQTVYCWNRYGGGWQSPGTIETHVVKAVAPKRIAVQQYDQPKYCAPAGTLPRPNDKIRYTDTEYFATPEAVLRDVIVAQECAIRAAQDQLDDRVETRRQLQVMLAEVLYAAQSACTSST